MFKKHIINTSIFILLFFIPISLHAKIITASSIDEVSHLITSDSWFIVDLDNTVFEGKSAVCHGSWFLDLMNDNIKQGMSKKEAITEAAKSWDTVQQKCEVKPVEPQMITLLRDLQKRGVVVMALTHRLPSVIDTTLRQLESIDIDFQKTAPASQSEMLIPPLSDPERKGPSRYRQGVLFVGLNQDKGDVLTQFLKIVNLTPKKIIFIDDSKGNVEHVEKTLQKTSIEQINIHYTAVKEKSTVYSPMIAAFQYKHFEKILTNEQAKDLMDDE